MELYTRIRQRREELHMTQDELAQAMGYKSRSSINKIELGKSDIPQSKIKSFAEALKTTPEYLMGLESNEITEDEYKEIFSRNLTRLLKKHHKSQKEVADTINVSPQTFNTWCKGIALPRMDKVQMLADYFGILKSDLIEDHSHEQEQSYYLNPETSKIAQQIYDNKELSLLFDAAKDAEPEDLQTVHSMLMALKRKEKGE